MTSTILTNQLPGYLTYKQVKKQLINRPISREEALNLPPSIRLRDLVKKIENLFVVDEKNVILAERINDVIISFLEDIDPSSPKYISRLYNTSPPDIVTDVITLVGDSGVGKSKAVRRSLSFYPQILTHKTFPHLQGGHKQVVYLSMLIRSSTKGGFYVQFATAWNEIFLRDNPNAPPPIDLNTLNRMTVDKQLPIIYQSLINHNVALIHFDEIQHLFKRVRVRGSKTETEVISKNNETVDMFLSLFTMGIPILISCTKDGLDGLDISNAVAQRCGCNYIEMELDGPNSKFLNELWEFQYTEGFLELTTDVIDLIFKYTAGSRRLIMRAFIETQRRVLKMDKNKMEFEDLVDTFKTFSPNLIDINQAIHNKDNRYISKIRDLKPKF